MRDELHDSDAAFERWLLDAARREEPPAALTEQAWARFAAASGRMAGAVSGHAGASWLGLHVSRASMGWLVLGLVAGSALTLTLVPSRQALPVRSTEELSAGTGDLARPGLPAGRASNAEASNAEAATATTPEAATADATSAVATTADATSAKAATAEVTKAKASNVRPARPRPLVRHRPQSTLAAEIEALDTVRAAIAAGHPVEALEGVAAFHRRFPRAQLGADAEGLAIEALLAQGAREEASERAKGFIRDYPRDPHVPRFAPIAEQ